MLINNSFHQQIVDIHLYFLLKLEFVAVPKRIQLALMGQLPTLQSSLHDKSYLLRVYTISRILNL